MSRFLVAALYKFVALPDYKRLRQPLLSRCLSAQVKGTLLLAHEGINGTISGPESGVREVLAFLRRDPRLAKLEHKESWAESQAFLRMKVRLKKEIVTMGVPTVDPNKLVGTYVKPEDWNALISADDVVVIDTRNDYEVDIGKFAGAVNPGTKTFREFPEWLRDSGLLEENKRVAMYCTGGIRCEKSTAYLKELGVAEVFHLQGGILKYLESVPEDASLWEGQCFVFDQRVSVGHGLDQGPYDLCHGCRSAIDAADKRSPHYLPGICCPKCRDSLTDTQKARFAERQKQMELAEQRGQAHLGSG